MLKIFLCDLNFFSVISVSLDNKGKYFSVIINVVFFVTIFQYDFRVFFSVKKSAIFSVTITELRELYCVTITAK